MKIDITAVILALLIWIGGGSWYWTCKVKDHCNGNETSAMADRFEDSSDTAMQSPSLPGFSVEAESSDKFRRDDPLASKIGSSELLLTPSLEDALDSLSVYLQNDKQSFLEITGRFASGISGENTTLALNRARQIGNKFIRKGLDSTRLIFSYGEAATAPAEDSLISAVTLHLLSQEAKEAPETLFEPRNLYFDFGKTNLPVTDDFRNYCSAAIRHLRVNPGATLSVTGHTDNAGSPNRNREVGLDRARRVADILKQFGANSDQVSTQSEGMDSPIASNDTEEGRAQNRRVEIRLNPSD